MSIAPDNYVLSGKMPAPQYVGDYEAIPSLSILPDIEAEYDRRCGAEDHWRITTAHKKAARDAFEAAKRQETPWSYRGDAVDWESDAQIEARAHESNEFALCQIEEKRRHTDYVEHCINLSGYALDESTYLKSLARKSQRMADSVELANILEKAGVRANFTGRPDRPRPFIVCPISRTAIALPVIRRVNFFPEQAAARRAPMLKEVENYLERNPWARMATFTNRRRIATHEIRGTHGELTRRISRLGKQPWFAALADLVFRASEFGTPKIDARTGCWTWHLHAHVIIKPKKAFPRKRWNKLLRRVRRYMGAHWDAGKKVEKPRELVKYPVKPADLKELVAHGTPMDLRDFFEATLKLRLTETLGDLREQRAEIRCHKLKRVKERNAEGEFIHATRKNWNKRGRPVTRDEERAESCRQRALLKARRAKEDAVGFCKLPERTGGAALMRDRIVARLAPAPYASRVYEPAAYVWNFSGDFDAIASHRCLAPAIAAVREFTAFRLESAQRANGGAVQQCPHQSRNCPAEQIEAPLVNAPPDPFRRHLEAVAS